MRAILALTFALAATFANGSTLGSSQAGTHSARALAGGFGASTLVGSAPRMNGCVRFTDQGGSDSFPFKFTNLCNEPVWVAYCPFAELRGECTRIQSSGYLERRGSELQGVNNDPNKNMPGRHLVRWIACPKDAPPSTRDFDCGDLR